MKKLILTITAISLSMSLLSCGADDAKKDSKSEVTTSVTSTTSALEADCDLVSEEFVTLNEQEMAENLMSIMAQSNSEGSDIQLYQQNAGVNGIYIYALDNTAGFSLNRMWQNGSYVYSRYYNDELIALKSEGYVDPYIEIENMISLTWAFKADGEIALQSNIDYWNEQGWPVNEIANKPGYYYIDCDVYQNYFWCEDGYAFELQIPTSVGTVDPETHEYSGEDVFALKKTFYPFGDNTVAE